MTLTTVLSQLQTLINQRAQIESQIEKLTRQEKGLKQIEGIILDFELTRDDLIRLCDTMHLSQIDAEKPLKTKNKRKQIIRYRDPVTGLEWTGVGRKPKWFKIVRANDYLLPNQEHVKAIAGQLAAEQNSEFKVAKKLIVRRIPKENLAKKD